MKIACVSVANPLSYLICYGIKDVENRSWKTDYRGPLYIHSAGKVAFSGMPDFSAFDMPVISEFNAFMAEIEKIEEKGRYLGFAEHGVQVYLKDEESVSPKSLAEYNLLSDVYNASREKPNKPFFLTNAIIGRADLVDVVENSTSEWAEQGAFHWVLRNPIVLRKPIPRVPGAANIWNYDIPDTERHL